MLLSVDIPTLALISWQTKLLFEKNAVWKEL
jgi:hypothetical protein